MSTPAGYIRAQDLPIVNVPDSNDYLIGIADVNSPSPYMFRTLGGGGGGGISSVSDSNGNNYPNIENLVFDGFTLTNPSSNTVQVAGTFPLYNGFSPIKVLNIGDNLEGDYDSVNGVLSLSAQPTLEVRERLDEGSNSFSPISTLSFRRRDFAITYDSNTARVNLDIKPTQLPGTQNYGGTVAITTPSVNLALVKFQFSGALQLDDANTITENLRFTLWNASTGNVTVTTLNNAFREPSNLNTILPGQKYEVFFNRSDSLWSFIQY